MSWRREVTDCSCFYDFELSWIYGWLTLVIHSLDSNIIHKIRLIILEKKKK